jgi:hypothetical protein
MLDFYVLASATLYEVAQMVYKGSWWTVPFTDLPPVSLAFCQLSWFLERDTAAHLPSLSIC